MLNGGKICALLDSERSCAISINIDQQICSVNSSIQDAVAMVSMAVSSLTILPLQLVVVAYNMTKTPTTGPLNISIADHEQFFNGQKYVDTQTHVRVEP